MKKQYWFGFILATAAVVLAVKAAPPPAPEPGSEVPTSASGSALINEVLAQDKAEGRGILVRCFDRFENTRAHLVGRAVALEDLAGGDRERMVDVALAAAA